MFTDVAHIVVEDTLSFLIHRKIDVSKFKTYRAIDGILNNNIQTFIDGYRVAFEKYFQDDMLLLRARIMNNFYFTFAINHGVKTNSSGVLKTDMGRKVEFSYVLKLSTYRFTHMLILPTTERW